MWERSAKTAGRAGSLTTRPAGRGQALDPAVQARMSRGFGHDFSQVRIHSDAQAGQIAGAQGAKAFTLGEDIVFGEGAFQAGSPDTERLLAHELTHVVQQTEHGAGDSERASRRGDASEREAESTAAQITAGGKVRVQAAPGAAVARTEEDEGSGGGSLWSRITGAVGGAWDRDVAHMRQDAASVRGAEGSFDRGIDWLENGASSLAHGAAGMVSDVPVLGSVANAGANMVGDAAQFGGGILKGAGGLVGGVAGVLADPVDAARGMEAMAEHVPIIPGVPNPLRLAHNALNVATGDETLGQFGQSLNPLQEMQDRNQFFGHVGSAIIDPYRQEIAQGRGMEALGRGTFDVGSILATAGGGAAVAGTADALRGAEVVADVSRGAEVAADVGRGAEVTADAARGAEATADAARGAGTGATDIGGMIDEELARGGAAASPGATPLDPATFPRTPGAPRPAPAPAGPPASGGNAAGPLDPALPAPNPQSSDSMVRWLEENGMSREEAERMGRQVDAMPEGPDPSPAGGAGNRPTSYARNRTVENHWNNRWRP